MVLSFLAPSMINTIKKIFGKEDKYAGNLFIQNVENKDVTIKLSSTELDVLGISPPLLIPFDSVTDLNLDDDSLSFIFNEEKFRLESKGSRALHEKMKLFATEKYIFKASKAEYYIYSIEDRSFNIYDKPIIIKIIHDGNYYLRIEDATAVIHLEEITTNTQYYMDQGNRSFVWSIFSEANFHTFCVKFLDQVDFLEFLTKYVECSYKSTKSEQNEHKFFEDMVKVQQIYKNPQNECGVSSKQPPSDDEQGDWSEYEKLQPVKNDFNQDEQVNKHLVIGNNQVFVARGSSLGVFGVTQDDLSFRSHIQNALNDPHKIITHNQDQSLLILDNDQKNKLQLLDLNKGEVVEKWDIGHTMNDYFDSLKQSNNGTLVGVSDYSLFRIDPRLKDKVAEKKDYKTKNEFSCGISTLSGDIAVASKRGDLRLYNKIHTRAKSLLPGFGDEIIGIDTSTDGSLILCTCKNYILVFNAHTDYSKAIGKNKPTPKRLQLKPQHLSFINQEVSFTPAKFAQNDDLIIPSTGRFVVKWRSSDVVAGNVYNYSLKALYDVIVDENFVFNGNDIVVTLPNDVKKVTEKELRNPNN